MHHAVLTLDINGQPYEVEGDPSVPLLYVLRNDLGLTGAKFGCGLEQCFACAVIVDGDVVPSCTLPVESCVGCRVTTVEGIGTLERLHPLQLAFIDEKAAQCGYCIPGMVVAAKALLDRNPSPNDTEIKQALDRHLCRCGSHGRIVKAVKRAAVDIT